MGEFPHLTLFCRDPDTLQGRLTLACTKAQMERLPIYILASIQQPPLDMSQEASRWFQLLAISCLLFHIFQLRFQTRWSRDWIYLTWFLTHGTHRQRMAVFHTTWYGMAFTQQYDQNPVV